MANPIKLESVSPKRAIDLHVALHGALQAWLASRDAAIWCLVSGTDSEGSGGVLDSISWPDAEPSITRMNQLRDLAYSFATQIGGERKAEEVLQTAVSELLEAESPRFVLRVAEYPGSF